MKFLPEEHLSISALLKEKGYAETAYSFTKKKGLLFIELNGIDSPFCYYRKQESRLNDFLKFEDVVTYYIGSKKDVIVDNWADVLSALEIFIDHKQITQ